MQVSVDMVISHILVYSTYRSTTKANLVARGSGCKGSNSFMRLCNHDSTKQTIPDAMHTIKDAVVNLFELITGKDDTLKCRHCELNHGGRFGINIAKATGKINRKEPGVPYSLSTDDIKLADIRAESIITPLHVGYIPGKFFTRTANLKSHDWKQVSIF